MADNLKIPVGTNGSTNDQHQDSSLTSVTSVTPDIPVMPHPMWTPDRVEERLRQPSVPMMMRHLLPGSLALRA